MAENEMGLGQMLHRVLELDLSRERVDVLLKLTHDTFGITIINYTEVYMPREACPQMIAALRQALQNAARWKDWEEVSGPVAWLIGGEKEGGVFIAGGSFGVGMTLYELTTLDHRRMTRPTAEELLAGLEELWAEGGGAAVPAS